MTITIPTLCVLAIVGDPSGRTTALAKRNFHFDEYVPAQAREVIDARLRDGFLTVVDMPDVQGIDHKPIASLGKRNNCDAVAVALNYGKRKADQWQAQLRKEGFRLVYVVEPGVGLEQIEFVRVPPPVDRRDERGPFDIVGDVHGCYDELCALAVKLGYRVDAKAATAVHPRGRKLVLLGDMVDRGPRTPDVLRLAMHLQRDGTGLCVLGNHDDKLRRKLEGGDVQVSGGLKASLDQLKPYPIEFRAQVLRFLGGLVDHYVLDGGNLVVAHAGLLAELQGRVGNRVRAFALYGSVNGKDDAGKPKREDWARSYEGTALVAYGHTPHPIPYVTENAINVDTGGVFGGQLTALMYPERRFVQVAVGKAYTKR